MSSHYSVQENPTPEHVADLLSQMTRLRLSPGADGLCWEDERLMRLLEYGWLNGYRNSRLSWGYQQMIDSMRKRARQARMAANSNSISIKRSNYDF